MIEVNTKQVNQTVAESTSIQVQEVSVLENESEIINTRGIEELSHIREASESSEVSFETEQVTLESLETPDDSEESVHGTKRTEPNEPCQAGDKEGSEGAQELGDNKRNFSQAVKASLTIPEKCEPHNEIKFVALSGKKKKSKKISTERTYK